MYHIFNVKKFVFNTNFMYNNRHKETKTNQSIRGKHYG